jgi:hypothetical protein
MLFVDKALANYQAESPIQFELNENKDELWLFRNPGITLRGFIFFIADDNSPPSIHVLTEGMYRWGFHIGITYIKSGNDKNRIEKAITTAIETIKGLDDSYLIARDQIVLFAYDTYASLVPESIFRNCSDFFSGIVIHATVHNAVLSIQSPFLHNYVCVNLQTALEAIEYCKAAISQKKNYELHVFNDSAEMALPGEGNEPQWWKGLEIWFNTRLWC